MSFISGLSETFGVIKGEEFEDSPLTRLESGVSDIIPGREYEYIVTVLVRNPSTIFSQTQNESADITSAADFLGNLLSF